MRATVEAWDRAAGSRLARLLIHPAGAVSDEAYEVSGRQAAAGLVRMLTPLIGRTATVVDFGCGDGRVAIPLSRTFDVIAVDASPAMLERLRARAPDLPTCLADGSDAGALPAPVDAVIALAVLIQHSHADAAAIVASLAATLRPGGVMVLGLPLYERPREPGDWQGLSVWTLTELRELTGALRSGSCRRSSPRARSIRRAPLASTTAT